MSYYIYIYDNDNAVQHTIDHNVCYGVHHDIYHHGAHLDMSWQRAPTARAALAVVEAKAVAPVCFIYIHIY